jgi:hypothetical protein
VLLGLCLINIRPSVHTSARTLRYFLLSRIRRFLCSQSLLKTINLGCAEGPRRVIVGIFAFKL